MCRHRLCSGRTNCFTMWSDLMPCFRRGCTLALLPCFLQFVCMAYSEASRPWIIVTLAYLRQNDGLFTAGK